MTRASERVRSPCENQQSEESLPSSLTEAGRLAMTSALWAPLDIEFQTFDRLIDRKPSRRPHHPPHQFTHNSHYHPPAKSLPKRLQKGPCSTWRRVPHYFLQKTIKILPQRLVIRQRRSSRLFSRPVNRRLFRWSRLCLPSASLMILHRLACSAADLVGAHALLYDRQQKSTW